MPRELVIKDLHAGIEGREILKGVNLTIRQGETHALMGPNGSGKSTLASTLMGHPSYEVISGEVLLDGESRQRSVLQPRCAVLDETDSGLDIDALRIVSEGVNAQRDGELGTLVITHYQRLLDYIKPEFVHILVEGRIVKEGGPELALELDQKGYEQIIAEFGEGDTGGATPAVVS